MDLALHPETGDLYLDGTEIATVTGLAAIEQDVRTRLRWWAGEWFLDTSRGTPYLEQVLGVKGVSEATVEAVLRRQIEAAEGVVAVTSIRTSIDRSTRRCVVDELVVATDVGALTLRELQVGGGTWRD